MANKPTIKRAPLGADLLMRRRALAMPTACLRQRYLRVDLDFVAFEGDRSMWSSIRSEICDAMVKTLRFYSVVPVIRNHLDGNRVPRFWKHLLVSCLLSENRCPLFWRHFLQCRASYQKTGSHFSGSTLNHG